MRCVAVSAGLLGCLVLASPERALARSSEYSQFTSPQPSQNWQIKLGAGVRWQPDYPGARDYVFRPRPIISLSRGLKSTWWSAEDDAISIGFFSGQAWRAGLSANLLWERKAKINPALVVIPATRTGGELGGFVEFYPTAWLRGRVDLRRGVRTHDALVADFKLDAITRIGSAWSLGVGPRMTITGADYVRTYYGAGGAMPGQGGLLKRYNAGVHTVGAIAQATYHWSERLQTTAYVEYKHLMGDAVRSPVVRPFGKRDSITLGISASYAFDLGF